MMPPAAESTSTDTLIHAAVRAGLIDAAASQALTTRIPAPLRATPDKLADWLVANGCLTRFQADKLMSGAERGLILGPYRMLAPVGRGGMGSVYLARDSRNQRLVALKVLPPHKYREEERLLTRFRREMEICQKVSHPHLTRTFESGVLNGVYYIAMEYIPGQSLRKRVGEDGPMPIGRTARIFSQTAAALYHAHRQGLIHRDVKPSNIMITPNGHAKLLDLGFALMEGEELPADKTIMGGQGYVVGTMDYVAPEQVSDPTGVDARADLYALGCSIYYTLTGQPPFPGGTAQQKIKRHLTDWPQPLTELNPTIPVDLAKLVERLMSKQPENRPETADQVRRLLRPWIGTEPELPIDTVVDNSTPRDVFDLELDKVPEGSFWETVPSTLYVNNSGVRQQPVPRTNRTDEPQSGLMPLWLIVAALFIFFCVLGAAIGTAIVMLK